MAINNIKTTINIFDINLILIFAGFPLFTTFVDNSLGSIAYRGVAMLIGLFCIIRSKLHINNFSKNKSLILFFLLYSLLTLKTVYELYLGEDAYTPFTNSRRLVMLFCFGIGWIPFLGAICSFDKIHKKTVAYSILFILLFVVGSGVIHRDDNVVHEIGRLGMNARQGSLAFGDNAAYLAIVSACFIKFRKSVKSWIYVVSFAGLILGIYGCAIAASRGPFISMVAGLFFIFLTLKYSRKITVLILFFIFIITGTLSYKIIEQVSPVLANRLDSTIETGDSSGRDVIFSEAFQHINENPILGSNPIILEPESFTGYHNIYLQFGVGLGIFGFLIFIGFILSILIRSLTNKMLSSNLFYECIGGLFWFYVVRGITGVSIIGNCIYAVVIAYICMILNKKLKHKQQYEQSKPGNKINISHIGVRNESKTIF